MSAVNPGGVGTMLRIVIRDKSSLLKAYMPFVKNGGIFLPVQREFTLGEEVFVLLAIQATGENLPVSGRVVWITPRGAQANRTPGAGIQFSDMDKGETRSKLEKLLAGSLNSDTATHTM
ncbi:MAG TPA: pilus assembly protein PilZ [Gammaproteobacteria bacterium]|nr:pilus assembly protein PilZ [Gammaproteobacteria bacterium]